MGGRAGGAHRLVTCHNRWGLAKAARIALKCYMQRMRHADKLQPSLMASHATSTLQGPSLP